MSVDSSKLRGARIVQAFEAALKAANTPPEKFSEGHDAFISAVASGESLEDAVSKGLTGRAPNGGSWLKGKWVFFQRAFGIDIDKPPASVEGISDALKKGAASAKKAAVSKRADRKA